MKFNIPMGDEEIKMHKPVSCDFVDFRAGVRCAERVYQVADLIKREQDWSMLEATQESLREHMAIIKADTALLRQALEALESLFSWRVDPDRGQRCSNAIAALRAALAEPVQEPVAWKHDCAALLQNDIELWIDRCPHCGKPRTHAPPRHPDHIADASNMVEQAQPVAKVQLLTTGGNVGLATRIVEIDDHLREQLRPGQLLYTAPPPRKPLTDEEIVQVLGGVREAITGNVFLSFARAIEAAHGIGSKT